MKGLLLINTGSPKSCNRKDVKTFIKTMLSDPQVMTVPDWIRPILVNGIAFFRQFSSTAHYAKVWDKKKDSSPLIYYGKELAEKLEKRLSIPVEIGMRYDEPSILLGLERLMAKSDRLHEVIILPLFPQYATSSYQTVVDAVQKIVDDRIFPFSTKIISPYFDHPSYISSLAQRIDPFLKKDFDKLIFTFHSLPISHVEAGWQKGKEFDYVFQAKETIRLLQIRLNLETKKIRLAFHSAIAKEWLQPDLNNTYTELLKDGCEKILVVAPGFAADNLETLYDINIKSRKFFLRKGGLEFEYIPCLNSEDFWVESVVKIINA